MVHASNLWSRRRIGHGPCIVTGVLYHHMLQSDKRRRFAVRTSQCLAGYDIAVPSTKLPNGNPSPYNRTQPHMQEPPTWPDTLRCDHLQVTHAAAADGAGVQGLG